MAFVTPEYVKSLQETHEAKFWKVYDSTGKTLINKLDTDIGMNKSASMLQDTLENCQADYVVCRLFTIAPTKTQAGATHDTGLTLKVKLDSMQAPKTTSTGISMSPGIQEYLALHDKIRQVENQLQELQHQRKIHQTQILMKHCKDWQQLTPTTLTHFQK